MDMEGLEMRKDLSARAETKRIASERIEILLNLARGAFSEDSILAQRYVDIALRIAMSCRVRIPREYRMQVCKGCHSLLIPGETSRVRIRQRREPHIAVTCLRCGAIKRMPMGRERSVSPPI